MTPQSLSVGAQTDFLPGEHSLERRKKNNAPMEEANTPLQQLSKATNNSGKLY